MKALMRILSAAVIVSLAVIAMTDVVIVGYIALVRRSFHDSKYFYRETANRAVNSRPAGYTFSGERVTADSGVETGWAIRYAAQFCRYCREDEAKWQSVKRTLASRRYSIVTIPVTAGDSYPEGANALSGSVQISYVDVEWIKQYRLSATPTTLIFNKSGQMIWRHAGVMSDDDEESALQAIGSNR